MISNGKYLKKKIKNDGDAKLLTLRFIKNFSLEKLAVTRAAKSVTYTVN